MRYEEHRPPAALSPYVECLWLAKDEPPRGPCEPERVLPDGCVEWIFHLAAPFSRIATNGTVRTQPATFVVGPMTAPLFLEPTGRVDTLGVRFRPGGAHPFLPVALDELTDGAVPTPELWGTEGRRIEDAVLHAKADALRLRILERFLAARLPDASRERRLCEAVKLVLGRRGRTSVERLARRVGWSPRQLEREFRRRVGLSPKRLSRIARFQNALRLAGRHPGRSWADLAAEAGYADQAHLTREFRELSGTTPREGRARQGDLARNFVEPSRLDALLDVAFVQDAAPAGP